MTADETKRERTRQPVRAVEVRKGVWQVSIRAVWPEDRSVVRERVRINATSRTAAIDWGRSRYDEIVRLGRTGYEEQKNPTPRAEVPTLRAFFDRYVSDYCEAERQKPSTISNKRSDYRAHLDGALGDRRLDEVTEADVQGIKAAMASLNPKTVDNVLGLLRNVLRFAERVGVIDALPCEVRGVQSRDDDGDGVPRFYEAEVYDRIVAAAGQTRPREKRNDGGHVDRAHNDLVVVLLAGDAGLRRGEIIALDWTDVDYARNAINVRKSIAIGDVVDRATGKVKRGPVETTPKSGKPRRVPMTSRLAAALRRQQGDTIGKVRVVRMRDGGDMTAKAVRCTMQRVERAAGLPRTGEIHILRHTFCSLMAMRGVPVDAIRRLAGHSSLAVTLRYMHLAPSGLDDAIRVLETGETYAPTRTGNVTATAAGTEA